MIDFSTANLRHFAATWVGNKNRYEGVSIPKQTLVALNDVVSEMMIGSLLLPFKSTEEFFYFHNEEDVSNNQVYQICMDIFADPDNLSHRAGRLATLLYEAMETPKLQGGEFYIAYFDDLLFNGEAVSGIALWKVQSKDSFFKSERASEQMLTNVMEGIPTGKPEIAALILNIHEPDGYCVCSLDTVTKKAERSFWSDDFMRLRPVEDHYFQTRHHMALVSEFITGKMPFKFGLSRTEMFDLLNRAGNYFHDNEYFDLTDFSEQILLVLQQQEAFLQFRDEYASAYAVPLENNFEISYQAVKKWGSVFNVVLKLDKNFRVAVNGRCDLIEGGYDEERGKKFYKFYFEQEN